MALPAPGRVPNFAMRDNAGGGGKAGKPTGNNEGYLGGPCNSVLTGIGAMVCQALSEP